MIKLFCISTAALLLAACQPGAVDYKMSADFAAAAKTPEEKRGGVRTFLARGSEVLFDRRFSANLGYDEGTNGRQYFATIFGDNLTRSECDELAARFTSLFGRARRNDGSIVTRFSNEIYV